MSEYKKQKAVKPKVEDVAVEILDNDKLQNLLNFIKYLKDNKLTPRWASANSWSIRYKNKGLCYVKIDNQKKFWNIRLERSFFDEYDKYITDDDMKKFILGIVTAPLCENRDCWKRINETIFGKTFDEVCRCWPFIVNNPDESAIEYLKELIVISKNIILDLTVPNNT